MEPKPMQSRKHSSMHCTPMHAIIYRHVHIEYISLKKFSGRKGNTSL